MLHTYILFLILGSLVSAIGFITNSTAAVMGSMLISPILTPVFEAVKTDGLINISNVSTTTLYLLVGMGICVTIGYSLSSILKPKETEEMISRIKYKETNSLFIMNAMIPAISGIILSVAQKQKDYMAIAGVGLSIAVLPPLVNSGMYLQKGKLKDSWNSFEYGLLNLVVISITYAFAHHYINF